MELPDGTTPIASKVVLYSNSETWQLAVVPPLPKILAEHNASNSTKYGKIGKREAESVIAKVYYIRKKGIFMWTRKTYAM